jgi:tetratricopeptide (TPR) repeat protein
MPGTNTGNANPDQVAAQLLDEGQALLAKIFDTLDINAAIELCNEALSVYKRAREAVAESENPDLRRTATLGVAEAYSQRGHQYRYRHDHAEALADLSQALKLNPGKAEDYYYRALSYIIRNEAKQARTDFTEYLRRGENDWLRQQTKERQAKLAPGSEDKAAQITHWRNEGMRFNSEASSVAQPRDENARPDWYRAIQLYNQAIEAFTRCLDANPNDAFTKMGMIAALREQAFAYRQVGESDLALDNYGRANKLRPDAEYSFLRGETLLEAGYLPMAKAAFEEYLLRGGALQNKAQAEKYLQMKEPKKAGS